MPYPDDQYNLKAKTNQELYQWLADYKPDTPEYIAGIEESMRRVASIEELIEKSEEPVRQREMIAVVMAIIALVVTIIAISFSY